MTVVEAVRARLAQVSAVTALVSTRIFTQIVPQDYKTWPAIRLQRVDEFETIHLRGAGGPVTARVQIDSIGTSLASAYAVDAAVNGDGAGSGLSGWQGVISGFHVRSILPIDVRDTYDAEELRLFKVMRDYQVVIAPVGG